MLNKIEKNFEKIFDIEQIVKNEIEWINKLKSNENSGIYEDCTIMEKKDIADSIITYIGKDICINIEGRYPIFSLYFRLEGEENSYEYELEYNMFGELSDDYFDLIRGEEKWKKI